MAEPDNKPDQVTSADSPISGKQQGRGKFYRRRRNKHTSQSPAEQLTTPPTKEKFSGRCEALNDYVFDVSHNKGGLEYNTTSKEIARYAGLNYSAVGSYVRTATLTLTVPAPPRPTSPTEEDVVDNEVFKEEV